MAVLGYIFGWLQETDQLSEQDSLQEETMYSITRSAIIYDRSMS